MEPRFVECSGVDVDLLEEKRIVPEKLYENLCLFGTIVINTNHIVWMATRASGVEIFTQVQLVSGKEFVVRGEHTQF